MGILYKHFSFRRAHTEITADVVVQGDKALAIRGAALITFHQGS